METKYNYVDAVWIVKENLTSFLDAVKPKEAFAVEDMGECYALSFSCEEDLARALQVDSK